MSAGKESLQAPSFTFKTSLPSEDKQGINSNTFPWALMERLDYISMALYEISRDRKEDPNG